MRILLLADADSSHTMKWAIGLHERGIEVAIFSLRKSLSGWNFRYPTIRIYDSEAFSRSKFSEGSLSKLSYLKATGAVKKAIEEFKPAIVHAHYATSYGLLGTRSKFHPLVISVWGSDVFEFPEKSFLHRLMVTNNLRRADAVFSTSHVMKEQVKKLVDREVIVTPFGVDLSVYKQFDVPPLFDQETKVVGTIKTLEPHYGIGALIAAFGVVKRKYSGKVKLVICGSGSEEEQLRMLVNALGMNNDVLFAGSIPQSDVPRYLNAFDVFANLSLRESFGVSIIEAMACEVPVVLSDVEGPREISGNGAYASMIKGSDPGEAGLAILKLLNEPESARDLAVKALKHVKTEYDWQRNLDDIISHYHNLIRK